MRGEPVKKDCSEALTPAQKSELEALAALPDDQINTTDIPEQRDWTGGRRRVFFRPI
jgi:hypothetical protein